MADKHHGRTSSSRTAAKQELDTLIHTLDHASSELRHRNDPCLEDVLRALASARRLQRRLRGGDRVRWKLILIAIVVLAKLTEKIFSILFCKKPRRISNANRVNHKNLANFAEDVPGGPG
jgi:hypothetical protein